MHISRVVQAGVERTAATIKSVNWSALPPRAAHRSGSENNGAGVGMSGQAWRVGDRRAVGDQAARAVDAAGEGRARHGRPRAPARIRNDPTFAVLERRVLGSQSAENAGIM